MHRLTTISTLLILLLCLSLSPESRANSSIDSLEQLLGQADRSPKDRLGLQLKIVHALKYRGAKVDSLLEEALEIVQTNDLPYDEALVYYYQYNAIRAKKMTQRSKEELLKWITRLEKQARQLPQHKELTIFSVLARSKFHFTNERFTEAIELLEETIRFAEKNGLEEHFYSLRSLLASCQSRSKKYYQAIQNNLLCLEYPNVQKAHSYSQLLDLYRQMKDWDKMLEYADLTYELAKTENNQRIKRISGLQKAIALYELNRFEESEDILNHLVKNLSLGTDIGMVFRTYLLKNYLATQAWDKAFALEDTLEKPTKHLSSYATTLSNLGKIHLINKHTQHAIQLCEESKVVAAAAGWAVSFNSVDACECLKDAYQQTGDYQKAFENLSLFNKMNAELNETEKMVNLSRALNQQELKQQEELLQLEQEKKETIYQAKLSRYKIIGASILALLALTFFTIFQLRNRNQKIQQQNTIITNSLEEKEILLKEIHHRVKNNLQVISGLLKWQSSFIEDSNALNAFNEGQNRVQSMAIIHQKLYQTDNLTGIDMADYIRRLSQSLFRSYNIKNDKVQLQTDIDSLNLDIDTVIPLGLILNELISNALKHAFPDNQQGKISIQLKEDSNKEILLLYVKDDGIGMKDTEPSKSKKSFGWELIETLSKKLKASLNVENQQGTQIQLKIKNYKLV